MQVIPNRWSNLMCVCAVEYDEYGECNAYTPNEINDGSERKNGQIIITTEKKLCWWFLFCEVSFAMCVHYTWLVGPYGRMSCTLTHTYVRAQSIWKDNFDLLMVNFCYFWYFSYLKFHNTSTHSIANRSTDLYSDFDWIEYACVCMCKRVLKRPRWLFFFSFE